MKVLTDLHVLSIPTRTNFRGITHREVVIFQGSAGWSEFSPFLEYSDLECKNWLRAALEAAYRPWPALIKKSVQINATLPKVSLNHVPEILKSFPGTRVVKIKVDSFNDDADLVAATLDFLPNAKIRLDINGGWNLTQALSNISQFLNRFGQVFEYFEQPCKSFEDLKKVKAELPITIAVDESIRKDLDSDLSRINECANIAIFKWQPLGGFAATKKLAELIKLPVVISSALETGIGLSHGLALASHFDSKYACGLGTANLLVEDIVNEPLTIENGEIAVIPRTPNKKLIEKYRASEDRRSWWDERINRILREGEFDEYIN